MLFSLSCQYILFGKLEFNFQLLDKGVPGFLSDTTQKDFGNFFREILTTWIRWWPHFLFHVTQLRYKKYMIYRVHMRSDNLNMVKYFFMIIHFILIIFHRAQELGLFIHINSCLCMFCSGQILINVLFGPKCKPLWRS